MYCSTLRILGKHKFMRFRKKRGQTETPQLRCKSETRNSKMLSQEIVLLSVVACSSSVVGFSRRHPSLISKPQKLSIFRSKQFLGNFPPIFSPQSHGVHRVSVFRFPIRDAWAKQKPPPRYAGRGFFCSVQSQADDDAGLRLTI